MEHANLGRPNRRLGATCRSRGTLYALLIWAGRVGELELELELEEIDRA